jgi:hypothetical protein
MFCKHFLLDHRALALRWAIHPDGLSEIITTHGIYLSTFSPIDLLENLSIKGRVILQTAPSDNIDCVWILNDYFQTYKVDEYRTDIVFENGTSLSIPESKAYLDHKSKRLHTFRFDGRQLNYIFPCIKEFNQQYYSNEYERQ